MATIQIIGSLISYNIDQGKQLRDLGDILLEYSGDDWVQYDYNSSKNYTRRVVYRDHNIDIILIAWTPHQESGPHDHPNRGCIVRMLAGLLLEQEFVINNNNLEFVHEHSLEANKLGYQEGCLGIHNMINPTDQISVSLHVYAQPEYVAKFY